MEDFKKFIYNHLELFTILGLGIVFYFTFFHNIWAYPLMDIDETRYVAMAREMFHSKDFLTLYLNGNYFFEKPPLYFWGECLSFGLFGYVSEFTARFPVAVYGTICSFVTYFVGRKIVSRKYGLISALILATSFEFVILSKFAILDIVVSTCVWLSVCSGIITHFCKDSHKKYFWWLFYIFSGLAVMAKGIPGFIIPFGSMFFISIVSKKFKEVFKPQYIIPGVLLFLLITLPWHIIMLYKHNPLFYEEYIIKHHLSRFFGGNVLMREEPFYFYILALLWGFLPWIISSLAVLIRKITKRDYNIKELTDVRRLLLYMGITVLFILIFFSSSDTKLITYILPIYPPLAFLSGYIWLNYVERGEYSKIINGTVYAVGILFILAGIAALFSQFYLPAQLSADIADLKPLCIVLVMSCGIFSILFVKKEWYIGVFFTYVIFMMMLSAFGTKKFFELDYKFGQNDLMQIAEYAKEHNKNVSGYRVDKKYSLIYYGVKHVDFDNILVMKDLSHEIDLPNTVVIVPKKIIEDANGLKYRVIIDGRKYLLIEKSN